MIDQNLTLALADRVAACSEILGRNAERRALPSGGDPRFNAVLIEMANLHVKKSTDYSQGADFLANVRASKEFGVPPWTGAMIRANDKVQRIKSYCLNGSLANEGLEDSLIDLACYAIIALILFREDDAEGAAIGRS